MHVIRRTGVSQGSGETGLSIPELLIATTILLGAIAVTGSFHLFELGTLRDQAIQLNVQSSAQTFVDLFAREIRGACGISLAAADRIRFQNDLDGDGRIVGADEDVTYVLDTPGRSILRVSDEGTEVILSGIDLTGSRLRYFGAGNQELLAEPEIEPAALAAVRRVRVEVALAQDSTNPANGSRLTAALSSDVELRSRFFTNEIEHPSCVPPREED